MAMVDVYHEQKERASSTSLIINYSNLTLLADQTGVVGDVVAVVHQTGLADTIQLRRYVFRKIIAGISMCRSGSMMAPW